ncbi:hypothetical protein cypCar_00032613 [Cyprinus carpio]|nr:hypothetical protein cypCar_00032613 [Cyprinus carpio]
MHQVPPTSADEAMISYESFLKVGEKAGGKCKLFFTARVYAKLLHNDPYGRISIMQFFNYVMRKVWLHQTRIVSSLYDVAGQGYLHESYLSLDKDHNGMLSKEELSRYGTGTLTGVFLDRVYL